MQETITSYVGLDIHKDSIAIAIAQVGRAAPRFVGTINPLPSELCKALRRQRCSPETTLLVYEAGPCGYGWVRYLRKQLWRCEVVAPSRIISWKAQLRLSKRWRALAMGRKLNQNKICVAIARELVGFAWDIARHCKLKVA
ncbi:MAG TPA: hypothetical protein VGR71_01615 [Nitrospira sp.]|nr:hypothetical protein [Nitrospira sp.]